MTNEEISKWLMNLKDDIGKTQYQPLWHYAEALDMAIEALSAEMSNLIKRQDAIDVVRQYCIDNQIEDGDYHSDGIEYELNNLPSAQPEPIKLHAHALTEEDIKNLKQEIDDLPIVFMPSAERKGKWIRMTADGVYWHECSECHEKPLLNRWHKQDEMSKFCPNCGARMRGEEDV